MIKVLRIINRFNLGGPTYNATFLSAFMGEEFETKLYGGKHEEHEGDSLFIPEQYGLQPVIIDALARHINIGNDRAAIKEIRTIIREFKPDIVHAHASKAGAIGRYAAYKENVPVIVHTFHGYVFHSYFGALKTTLYKGIERFLAQRTDAIVAISDIQKNELVSIHKIAKARKVSVIPLGFDLNKFNENRGEKRTNFREEYQVEADDIAIALIGRFAPIKNHLGFIKSINKIARNTEKKCVVFLIGDGELRPEIEILTHQVEEAHDNIRFVLTSWIKDVDRVLPGLDIVALSSFNEGTPVSLIESQAAGVPVLSTDVGGVRDIVKDGQTGVISPPFEEERFANDLLELIENEEKRHFMSQNGWNHVHEKFHYERLCSDMGKLYRELLNKKQKNEED